MKRLMFALALVLPPHGLAAQPAPTATAGAYARHVVMITRAGPNFAKVRDHMEEARSHQQLYQKLAAEGVTIAGGPFEGNPIMGMTVWSEGVDEAKARELIKSDQLPQLGITVYEFRTLVVRNGSFKKQVN